MSVSGCRYAWCQVRHAEGPDLAHRAILGTFDGPGRVWALLLQSESGGRLDEPFVRIVYTLDERERGLEISPQTAADLADILGGLSILGRDDLAAAFAAVGHLQITAPGQLLGDLDQSTNDQTPGGTA
ncbi:hypothetical protein [Streptosporangium sp. NPDC002524]|uniref:hypothetical protein n=1 Tax=Streptosporangium sp. NPDC002524 TaxID=3154537 RepID=UPI0033283459